MDRQIALKIFSNHLLTHHHLSVDDVVITETPGYWEMKEPCDPKTCSSPLHGYIGCSGAIKHTVSFAEYGVRDQLGRFVSPHRIWKTLQGAAV